jgi:hypothetical protein
MDPTQTLVILVEGALMGLLGQGSRAVAGLKSMSDDAQSLGVSSSDLFQAARLFVSCAIGVLVGLAAALIYLMSNPSGPPDWHVLLGFAAAGYAGTDFLEAFISRYLTPPAADKALTAKVTQLSIQAVDEPGEKEQAIMDSITAWLQQDQKLPPGQDVDPAGTMHTTYHFSGSPEIATFLRGVAGFLTTKHYNYDYTKDTSSSATLNKLVTETVTAVAYQIGKNTKYMTSGVTV